MDEGLISLEPDTDLLTVLDAVELSTSLEDFLDSAGVTTRSVLPGDLGGETGGAEGNTSHVVLLVDGGGSLAGDLTGVAGHDGVDVGLGLLAAAVQVEVLVDVGEGGGSPGVGGVILVGGRPQRRTDHRRRVERRVGSSVC